MAIEKWSDEVTIVHLGTDPQFTDDLSSLDATLKSGLTHVILDFGGVQFLNSSNLSRLLKLRKQIHDGGHRLILCGISAKAWSTFLVTGLDKVFEYAESVPMALATLQIT